MAPALTSIGIAIVSDCDCFLFLDLYDSVHGTVFLLLVFDRRSCAEAGGNMLTL